MRQQWECLHDVDRVLATTAAQIYTSGQFFGLLFVMLLGAILMTNEYYHQTATATFLTTPQRTKVILAKLGTAVLAAGFFWVLTTAISVAAGAYLLQQQGIRQSARRVAGDPGDPHERPGLRPLGHPRASGLGVLIRNQIGAVIVGAAGYILGTQVVQLAVFLVSQWLKSDGSCKAHRRLARGGLAGDGLHRAGVSGQPAVVGRGPRARRLWHRLRRRRHPDHAKAGHLVGA